LPKPQSRPRRPNAPRPPNNCPAESRTKKNPRRRRRGFCFYRSAYWADEDDEAVIGAASDEEAVIGAASEEDAVIGAASDDEAAIGAADDDGAGAADEDGAGAADDETTALELAGATGAVVLPPRLKIQIRPMMTITATMMIIQVLRFMGRTLGWWKLDREE